MPNFSAVFLECLKNGKEAIVAGGEYVLGRVIGGDVIRSSMDHGNFILSDVRNHCIFFFE